MILYKPLFDRFDMNTPYPSIEKDLEFPKVLVIKEILQKFQSGKTVID
jgi:hypothetical protein